MECNDIQPLLADYAVGDLRGEARDDVEAHVAHCYWCREALSDHEMLIRACRTALRHPAPLDSWEEVRIQMDLSASPVYPRWRALVRRRIVMAVAAAAAVIALILGGTLLLSSRSGHAEAFHWATPATLASDGLIAVAASSHAPTPLQRYQETVSYYFHALDLETTPPAARHTAPPDIAAPSTERESRVSSIGRLKTNHIYV